MRGRGDTETVLGNLSDQIGPLVPSSAEQVAAVERLVRRTLGDDAGEVLAALGIEEGL